MSLKIGLQEKIALALVVMLLVGGGIWRAVDSSKPVSEPVLMASSDPVDGNKEEQELITVHLVGAVNAPGVYHLPAGSRVFELVEAAGGFSEDANQEAVNQARPLFDGEQIYIYRLDEVDYNNSGISTQKININHADVSELSSLPGIGEVRAEQIVNHRETHGFFTDTTEIMDVSGIGEATYNNIVELITIY